MRRDAPSLQSQSKLVQVFLDGGVQPRDDALFPANVSTLSLTAMASHDAIRESRPLGAAAINDRGYKRSLERKATRSTAVWMGRLATGLYDVVTLDEPARSPPTAPRPLDFA